MSQPLATRVPVLAVLGASLLLSALACSSSTEPTLPDGVNIATLPPPTDGANCTDPTGDISDSAAQVAGSLAEPAGIDLVRAEAKLTDTEMVVTYTTAGAIAAVAEPQFFLSQGVSGQSASFELRTQPTSSNGPWTVDLITWGKDGGGLSEAPARTLSAPVTVSDRTLTYTVPLDELPKILTLVWQFGATAALPPKGTSTAKTVVLDDCNNMVDQEAPGSTVATTEAPSTTVPTGGLGAELVHPNGATVTVTAFQKPPANLKPLAVPPSDGFEPAVAEAEICAGGEALAVRAGNFRVLTTENELWGYWDEPQTATDPAFPEPTVLQPGDCRKGWITYQLPTDAVIAKVIYSPDTDGENYLAWTV